MADEVKRGRGRPTGTAIYPWDQWHAQLLRGEAVVFRPGRDYVRTTKPYSFIQNLRLQMSARKLLGGLKYHVTPAGQITVRWRGQSQVNGEET